MDVSKSNGFKITVRGLTFNTARKVLLDYADHSTIAGLVYFALKNQTVDARIFWLVILLSFVILSTIWSWSIYINWNMTPVVTTMMTAGLSINSISFPSVTVCPQGSLTNSMKQSIQTMYLNLMIELCNSSIKNISLDNVTFDDPCTLKIVKKTIPGAVDTMKIFGNLLGLNPVELVQAFFTSFTANSPSIFWQNTWQNSVNTSLNYDVRQSTLDNQTFSEALLDFTGQLSLWYAFFTWSSYQHSMSGFMEFKKIYESFDSIMFLKVLWGSSLKCSDQGESFIQNCFWKGSSVPCTEIFEKTFSDLGICCSFNKKSLSDIYKDSPYISTLKSLQNEELGKETSSIKSTMVSQAGINKGLTFMINIKSNQMARTSIDSEFNSFNVVVDSPQNFPLTMKNGISVESGQNTLIAMGVEKTESTYNIRSISPKERNCYFEDETEAVNLYNFYSRDNCIFECLLEETKQLMQQKYPDSKSCTPWRFPTYDENYTMCSPYQSSDFLEIFNILDPKDCGYCLPDCNNIKYLPTMTTEPFRKCNEKNFGVSSLCDYKKLESLPLPHLWGQQVLSQLGNRTYLSEVSSNIKSKKTFWPISDLSQLQYDANEEDIAMVSVFFDSSTAIMYQNEASQTWFSYFANVGGILGLFVGANIVTLFEIVWLFVKIGQLLEFKTKRKSLPIPKNKKTPKN